MKIKVIDHEFSVCKVKDFSAVDRESPFCFTGKTDEENSLVCVTGDVPANALEREDGWRAFRIEGILDFSLIGILSKITTLLAENSIGIFAISTYNTDYILTKKEDFSRALDVLAGEGYEVDRSGEEKNPIDAYIADQPAKVRPLLNRVRDVIREVLPNAEERISWRMPTYWEKHNIIHFAAFKNHMGLYPGAEAMKSFAPRLTEYKTSKGAVQFPYDKPLPLPLIAEMAEWCYETGNHH